MIWLNRNIDKYFKENIQILIKNNVIKSKVIDDISVLLLKNIAIFQGEEERITIA